MADEEVKLPATKPYRVVIGGAAFDQPTVVYDETGKGQVRYIRGFGRRGEVIDLVPREAHRLQQDHIAAVVDADSPPTYNEMDDTQLAQETRARNLVVTSSSADPDRPLRTDFINALETYERGGEVSQGVSAAPGGIVVGGARLPEPGDPQQVGSASEIDASQASVEEIAAFISEQSPNASETVDLAQGDPATAGRVLEAEEQAQGGDPRKTVVDGLEKIANG